MTCSSISNRASARAASHGGAVVVVEQAGSLPGEEPGRHRIVAMGHLHDQGAEKSWRKATISGNGTVPESARWWITAGTARGQGAPDR